MAMKINPETLTPVDSMETCLHCKGYVSSGPPGDQGIRLCALRLLEHQVHSKPRPDRID